MTNSWILALSCADRMGIVAGVTSALREVDAFILDSQQYADLDSGRFFMRIVFSGGGENFPDDAAALEAAIAPIAAAFALRYELRRADHRPKVLIAVSKGSHCLVDLLHRWRSGVLAIEPVGIVSNHPDLEPISKWYDIPYHYLPVVDGRRAQQERSLLDLFTGTGAELLVLARYMQILSADLANALDGRCVNIHHSFLPSFKGAQPYQRAHARGVKLIGATAHFVSSDLDEGPIIEQAVERVDHRATAADLARIGRDIEAQSLARAVGWIAQQRVFLNGNCTVVFS